MSDHETQAFATHLIERLRSITIGSYSYDHGSHWKNIPVAPVCREAADLIEQQAYDLAGRDALIEQQAARIAELESQAMAMYAAMSDMRIKEQAK